MIPNYQFPKGILMIMSKHLVNKIVQKSESRLSRVKMENFCRCFHRLVANYTHTYSF